MFFRLAGQETLQYLPLQRTEKFIARKQSVTQKKAMVKLRDTAHGTAHQRGFAKAEKSARFGLKTVDHEKGFEIGRDGKPDQDAISNATITVIALVVGRFFEHSKVEELSIANPVNSKRPVLAIVARLSMPT